MQRVAEEHGAHFRAAERQAEVTRLRRVHGVHGESPGDVGGFGEDVDGQGLHGENWV